MTSDPVPDDISSVETRTPDLITPGRVALLVGVVALIPYLLTLSGTFGFVDKGELVAVASTLGISHPTGYPVITMLGFLFTKLVPGRDVFALNLMAALLTAGSAVVLTLLFDDLLRRISASATVRAALSGKKGKQKGKGKAADSPGSPGSQLATSSSLAPSFRALYAGLGALILAFTSTWWEQGNSYEVYSLHTLMMPLVTLLFLRYMDEESAREGKLLPGSSVAASPSDKIGFTRRALWFSVVLGLAFANHLTTILLAPAFLVYYFWTVGLVDLSLTVQLTPKKRVKAFALLFGVLFVEIVLIFIALLVPLLAVWAWCLVVLVWSYLVFKIGKRQWGRLLYLAPGFIIGLLPYLYLPIRAAMQPFFNWGDPDSIKRFMDHVGGKQYQVWMFAGGEVRSQQTWFFLNNLPSEFAYLGVLLALLGIVHLAQRNIRLTLFVVLLFAACILYAGGFDIMEIGPYFLTANFAVAIWCVAGLVFLHERFGSRLTIPVAALIAILTCVMNYSESDESNNYLVEDMTVNMLNTLPKDALVISGQWDYWVAGSYYLQHVEGMRPDVTVVDPELMRRSWYLDQLEANYPDLMAPIKPQVDAFRKEVYKFEYDLPLNTEIIQTAYVNMLNALVDSSIGKRPVHVTAETAEQYIKRYPYAPWYLTLRLMTDTAYLPQEFPNYRFRFWGDRINPYAAKLSELYARAAWTRALYERQHGHEDLARRYADYIFTFEPQYRERSIPDFPLNSEEQITGMMGLFDELRGKMQGGKK